ncbi:uncharacterized protein EV420DRAFT_1485504 [Desarmillaria tabescens]|uniref:Uncharacterized protein n=1 Tax=Armillaria tabescens TaxID=1929756 RepID=A0AA39JGN8_ARMTA|nr:uncharacterized protein EV420DRAFT_1485504 [Desarmillaria tabescens]KAK0441762.1 hypothetical protein EV420DRAFT_1485504 [Desarmillaria tabescens]
MDLPESSAGPAHHGLSISSLLNPSPVVASSAAASYKQGTVITTSPSNGPSLSASLSSRSRPREDEIISSPRKICWIRDYQPNPGHNLLWRTRMYASSKILTQDVRIAFLEHQLSSQDQGIHSSATLEEVDVEMNNNERELITAQMLHIQSENASLRAANEHFTQQLTNQQAQMDFQIQMLDKEKESFRDAFQALDSATNEKTDAIMALRSSVTAMVRLVFLTITCGSHEENKQQLGSHHIKLLVLRNVATPAAITTTTAPPAEGSAVIVSSAAALPPHVTSVEVPAASVTATTVPPAIPVQAAVVPPAVAQSPPDIPGQAAAAAITIMVPPAMPAQATVVLAAIVPSSVTQPLPVMSVEAATTSVTAATTSPVPAVTSAAIVPPAAAPPPPAAALPPPVVLDHISETSTLVQAMQNNDWSASEVSKSDAVNVLTTLMRALGIEQATVQGSRVSSQTPKYGKLYQQILRKFKPQVNHPDELLCKSAIRSFWRFVYGVDRISDFVTYEPVDLERVSIFVVEKVDSPGEDTTLDFGEGWNHSQWNIAIMKNLLKKLKAMMCSVTASDKRLVNGYEHHNTKTLYYSTLITNIIEFGCFEYDRSTLQTSTNQGKVV